MADLDHLPSWVDAEKWRRLDVQNRWNGAQVVLAILGNEGPAAGMAALRGIPNNPPPFLKKREWDASANSRHEQAVALEASCAADVALETKAEQARAEAMKTCVHEYGEWIFAGDFLYSRACNKCGHVDEKIG